MALLPLLPLLLCHVLSQPSYGETTPRLSFKKKNHVFLSSALYFVDLQF